MKMSEKNIEKIIHWDNIPSQTNQFPVRIDVEYDQVDQAIKEKNTHNIEERKKEKIGEIRSALALFTQFFSFSRKSHCSFD